MRYVKPIIKKKKKNTERKMIINIPDWWKRFD